MSIVEMKSKYPGKCAECKGAVSVGDVIFYNSSVTKNKVKHKECHNKPKVEEAPALYRLHPETMIQSIPVFRAMKDKSDELGFNFREWTPEQMNAHWEYCLKYLNAEDTPPY